MAEASEFKRMAFSPGEFAKLFGKSQTWGYRQIYAGKVKAITEFGRTLIAAAEVEKILKTAGVYDGLKPKTAKTKAQIQSLAPGLQSAWRSYLAAKRQAVPTQELKGRGAGVNSKWPSASTGRQDALKRLTVHPKSI